MPESRHSAVLAISGKIGGSGAIRTPDPQIRRPMDIRDIFFIFQWLPLTIRPQASVEIRQFPTVCDNFRHNLAILDGGWRCAC